MRARIWRLYMAGTFLFTDPGSTIFQTQFAVVKAAMSYIHFLITY
jgi:hypothetical protein